jgi:hypothetical protein
MLKCVEDQPLGGYKNGVGESTCLSHAPEKIMLKSCQPVFGPDFIFLENCTFDRFFVL